MTSRLRRMTTPSSPSANSRKLTTRYCSSPTFIVGNPKSEIRSSKEARNPNIERPQQRPPVFGKHFGLRASDFFRISFQVLFAQQNHAHHRHEQQHRDDFKGQHILPEQELAEFGGAAFERERCRAVWMRGTQAFQGYHNDGTD